MNAIQIDPEKTYLIKGNKFQGEELIKYLIDGMRYELYKKEVSVNEL